MPKIFVFMSWDLVECSNGPQCRYFGIRTRDPLMSQDVEIIGSVLSY